MTLATSGKSPVYGPTCPSPPGSSWACGDWAVCALCWTSWPSEWLARSSSCWRSGLQCSPLILPRTTKATTRSRGRSCTNKRRNALSVNWATIKGKLRDTYFNNAVNESKNSAPKFNFQATFHSRAEPVFVVIFRSLAKIFFWNDR